MKYISNGKFFSPIFNQILIFWQILTSFDRFLIQILIFLPFKTNFNQFWPVFYQFMIKFWSNGSSHRSVEFEFDIIGKMAATWAIE